MQNTGHNIRTILASSGIRVTPQRIAIYTALSELGHATAEQITAKVHSSFPTVTIGTMYNVLACFLSVKLISKLNTSDNKMYFDINTHDHHHMQCEKTGQITDFGNAELTELIHSYYETNREKSHPNFELTDIRVQLIGNFK